MVFQHSTNDSWQSLNTFAAMRIYPSKILLFGEYILLTGGAALAVPVPAFFGKWGKSPVTQPSGWQEKLLQFAYSSELEKTDGLDVAAFIRDLKNGLVFASNIPAGYGMGSSGALCAGVYDRYCHEKTEDLEKLKVILAGMESFFHGTSSGIDPLTSYVERALLIRQKTLVEYAETVAWDTPPIVFLLDSAAPRKTADLVPWYLEKARQPAFAEMLQQGYLPAHELLLGSWLQADATAFWHNLRLVSRFQLDYFIPMIPDSLRGLWSSSLENGEILFKICGAGGGGYLLGFSRSAGPIETLSEQYKIVYPFSTNKP